MNFLGDAALVSAAVALCVAAFVSAFARSPGWETRRSFTLVALSAGIYGACGTVTVGNAFERLMLPMVMVQMAIAAVHVVAWSRYADAVLGEKASRPVVWWHRVILAVGVLELVPGLCFTGELVRWRLEWLGVDVIDPVTTTAGEVAFAIMASGALITTVRFALAARRGRPRALVHALCLTLMALMAASDALTVTAYLRLPYLLDAGFILPVAVVAHELIAQLHEDADALGALRNRLEGLVVARTADLEASQRALVRAESLAGLGRMAAAVAHEVNNPTAAILANLQYLSGVLTSGRPPPPDVAECLRESEEAAHRVAGMAKQLLDSSRLAGGRRIDTSPILLAEPVHVAVEAVAPRRPPGVQVRVDLSRPSWVVGDSGALERVVANLLLNAFEAIATTGHGSLVTVSTRPSGKRIALTVEDDGPGMSPSVLSRVFEPFFSTKPLGFGTGLGLAVSHGLTVGMGGELVLESQPGGGTKASVLLPLPDATAKADITPVPA